VFNRRGAEAVQARRERAAAAAGKQNALTSLKPLCAQLSITATTAFSRPSAAALAHA